MKIKTTMVVKEVSPLEFRAILGRYEGKIKVSPHATDQLSDAQRKVFKQEDLINPLLKEKPNGIGRQKNRRISVWYKRKEGYLRLILADKPHRLEIVTFTKPDTMPNFKKL